MKISVVIPSFNQAKFLGATLESVCSQVYRDKEILVFDGGSTDGSAAVLEAYGDRLWWTSEKDRGQADAINKGLALSSGEILAYLNSDDVYYPGALQAVAEYFEAHPQCLMLYGAAHHLRADGSVMEEYPTEPWNYERLQDVCFLCQPAVFWRREVLERFGVFDDRLHYALDYDYWLRVGRYTPLHYLAGQFLAGSRLHAETKTLSHRVKAHHEILRVVQQHATQPGAVYRWLRNLAHLHAAEAASADEAAPSAERKRFASGFVAYQLLYAREFDIPLDETMLTGMEADLQGIGL